MITIIDYGLGNIRAFVNVYDRLNIKTKVAKNIKDLEGVNKIILPGVGHFDYAMQSLENSGMKERINDLVLNEKTPVIGICVGMQMMSNRSDEGKLSGLGWIDGEVKLFDESKINYKTKLPHMGWNDIEPVKDNKLLDGLNTNSRFYFLHSYYFRCNDKSNIIAETIYGEKFASAVYKDNIYGIQFHPEKSHSAGIRLLKNFAEL